MRSCRRLALNCDAGVLKDVCGDICLASESGEFSAVRSMPMGLGTKNRQKQTADLCKTASPGKYPDKLGLVEESGANLRETMIDLAAIRLLLNRISPQ